MNNPIKISNSFKEGRSPIYWVQNLAPPRPRVRSNSPEFIYNPETLVPTTDFCVFLKAFLSRKCPTKWIIVSFSVKRVNLSAHTKFPAGAFSHLPTPTDRRGEKIMYAVVCFICKRRREQFRYGFHKGYETSAWEWFMCMKCVNIFH